MKRSAINQAYREALACFSLHHWALPAHPMWDITDFGLGDFERNGLVLVNLADEPEYGEKLMCRAGELTLRLWPLKPSPGTALPASFSARIDGRPAEVRTGTDLVLRAGSRVTLEPGVWHSFWPSSADCIMGEVSTKNDDVGDNFFLDGGVGRFPEIDEDEPAAIRLIRD